MYAVALIALLLPYAVAEKPDNVAVDLLSNDFIGYKDVQRTNDSVSFGPKTGNLAIDKQSIDKIVRYSKNFKDRTLFLVGKLRSAAYGKNTLVFLKNPLTNRVYFEVSVVKEKAFQRVVEGWMDSKHKNAIDYNLVLTYTSMGKRVEKTFSINDKFKEGKWFTLAVRVLGDSDVEVTFDCTLLERVKLLTSMDSIPSYLAGRLSQSTQRDIFTLKFMPYHRFVGEMKRAIFVFGKKSFQSLNPCKHQNTHGFVLEGTDQNKALKGALKIESGGSKVTLGTFDIFHNANCMYNWKHYANGEEWSEEPCQMCKCQNGQTICKWTPNCRDFQIP